MKNRHGLDQVFWSKVDKTLECWIWKGFIHHSGYGYFRHVVVHRYIFQLLNIEIPENKEVHHKCQNKLCVNPDHLELVFRYLHRIRHKEFRTHCKRGHEFTKENTVERGNARECRECNRLAVARYKRRLR